jgi:hypothetical protein
MTATIESSDGNRVCRGEWGVCLSSTTCVSLRFTTSGGRIPRIDVVVTLVPIIERRFHLNERKANPVLNTRS